MPRHINRALALGLVWILSFMSFARAQFSINGVTDKYYNYSDSVTFTISNQPGYSCFAMLDTNRVPIGVPVTVNTVDYHELRVSATNGVSGAQTNALVRFIVQSSERNAAGSTENGLPPWTPWPVINSASNEFSGANLLLILPQDFPAGYEIPVVAWVLNPQGHAVRANGLVNAPGQPAFQVKRGVGSGLLLSNTPAGVFNYTAQIGGLVTNKALNIESAPTWTNISGTISANTTWGPGAHLYVTNTLTIVSTATLTVEAGAIIRIGPGVDVFLDGNLMLNGTVDRPIIFMPNARTQPWGGFWLSNATSQISGAGTIFTGSGANQTWFGTGGRPSSHRPEQALFYCTNRATITLTNSAAVYLSGQLSHSVNGGLYFFNYTRFLSQYNTTGGEHTDSVWNVNDSALIDSHINSVPFSTFYDGDEDALYLVNIPNGYASGFTNTLVGWTRDDGVDSGGSGSGVLNFRNCWFESTYHEGNALSGLVSSAAHPDKLVTHTDSVFLGLGQAFENGYGAVTGRVDHCLMLGNLSGVRFGDNYQLSFYGITTATNCICINNYRDVWGMTWQPDTSGPFEGWLYRTNQLDVQNNFLSAPNPAHPTNAIWNPAADAGRLTSFMTTPLGGAVGIGFATWTNAFDFSALFAGVPVGLSSFTTNSVSVDYTFKNAGNLTLATGTLSFAPGETVKRIYPAGFDLTTLSQVRLVLSNSQRGELTGETNVLFSGAATTPAVNCWVAGNQMELARIGEGVPLKLSGPTTLAVSVPYKFENNSGTIQSGMVLFNPGETVKWVSLNTVLPPQEVLVRFSVGNPVGAISGTATNLYFVKTVISSTLTPTTLLAQGSIWKYYDTVTNTVAGWAATNFNDGSWLSGPSPLGYAGNPVQATTVGYGPNSSAKYISTYFRTTINVTNLANLASLTFNLMRDDGAVIYLNGAEVYRENMPAGTILYTTLASTTVSGAATWTTQTVSPGALSQPLHTGTNTVAVEIHQSVATSSDILMNLEIIGNPVTTNAALQQLYLGRFDGKFLLAWGDATFGLLQSTNLAGPWLPLTTNSPAALSPVASRQFYRLFKP